MISIWIQKPLKRRNILRQKTILLSIFINDRLRKNLRKIITSLYKIFLSQIMIYIIDRPTLKHSIWHIFSLRTIQKHWYKFHRTIFTTQLIISRSKFWKIRSIPFDIQLHFQTIPKRQIRKHAIKSRALF